MMMSRNLLADFLQPDSDRDARLRVYDAVLASRQPPEPEPDPRETETLLSGILWHLRHGSEAEAISTLARK